jgi:uncharacterized membrane protein
MKTRKYIYLIVGIVLILINCLLTYDMVQSYDLIFTEDGYAVAQILGNQLFTIIGLFLLMGAYRVQRKINRKKKQELENAFTERDSQQ